MRIAWGLVVTALSLLAWVGQAVSAFAPETAVRWKLLEAEDDVEPAFWVDARAEAGWDTLTLWAMAAAGVLMVADAAAWPYFGLVGGGMYLYFGGRGIAVRVAMTRAGLRVGSTESVRTGIIFLAVWATMAVITFVAAVVALS